MNIKYEVNVIPQMTSMSCWAASISMILGWKRKMSIPDEEIAKNPGGKSYMTSYTKGLDPNDKRILNANGFKVDAPQCYTANAIGELLRFHGPLWVATWAPGPHVRVVSGLLGGTVLISDPAPIGEGSQYKMAFSRFFGAMENLGEREMNEKSPVYVAYLR